MTTPAVTISARRASRWRCGVEHKAAPRFWEAGAWSGDELDRLRADPELVVVEGEAPAAEAGAPALDAAVAALRGATAHQVEAFIARLLEDPEVNTLRGDRPAQLGELAPFVIDVARAAEPDVIREFLREIAEDPTVAAKLAPPAEAEAEDPAAEAEPPAEAPSFADIVAQLAEGDFGRDGKPKVGALERVTGEDWNGPKRDAAWAGYEASAE